MNGKNMMSSAIVIAAVALLLPISDVFAAPLPWNDALQVNPGVWPSSLWEPSIVAQAGGSGKNFVVGAQKEGGDNNCHTYYTSNAGNTAPWSEGTFNTFDPKGGYAVGADTTVATMKNGTIVFSCMGITTDSTGVITGSIQTIWKSTNNGQTFNRVNYVYNSVPDIFLDKPWIAIDNGIGSAYTGRWYNCWTNFDYANRETRVIFAAGTLGQSGWVTNSAVYLDRATWNATDPKAGPYVQGCQVVAGPGRSGYSNNEIFVAWERINGYGGGEIRFNANYNGGVNGYWAFSGSGILVGSINRFTDFSCDTTANRIYDGCLPGNLASFRAGHLPSMWADKNGNPNITWTTYDTTDQNAHIMYASGYNANIASQSPQFNSPVRLTSTSDNVDHWEPAITVFDDGSTRGRIVITYVQHTSTSTLTWDPWSLNCKANATSGSGSCSTQSDWTAQKISNTVPFNSNGRRFVGDYHVVASSTTDIVNTYAWHRTPFPLVIYGDIMSFTDPPGNSCPCKIYVNSKNMTGDLLTGYYQQLVDSNGNQIAAGWTPVTFTGLAAGTYTVYANDFSPYFFDHWENGSTARGRTVTLPSDQAIVAYYRHS